MTAEAAASPGASERLRVFISAKSADYPHAEKVYRHLREAGIPAFFSRESLPELGNTGYLEEIDRALAEADHMVVVTSAPEHVLAPWVAAEWRFFINEQRSGRKQGNLMTVVAGALEFAALPPSLRQYECLRLSPAALDTLLRYLDQPAGRPAAGPEPPRRRSFRPVATFGGRVRINVMAVRGGEPAIACGGFDGGVGLYESDTRTRKAILTSERFQLAGAEAMVTALAFSGGGDRIASGQLDGVVHIWEVETGRELGARISHQGAVTGLGFLDDGHTLVSGSRTGEIKVSRVESLRTGTESLLRSPAPIVAMAVHPGRGWLVAGLADPPSRRFGFQIQEAGGTFRVLCFARVATAFTCLAVAPDGEHIAAGCADGAVRLYETGPIEAAIAAHRNELTLEPLAPVGAPIRPPHHKPVKSVAFLPDGRGYLSTGLGNTVVLWDRDTRKPAVQAQGEPDESYAGAQLLPDGHTLVAALSDGRLRLWESG